MRWYSRCTTLRNPLWKWVCSGSLRLDGTESAQHAHLLHGAHHRVYIQTLEFRVHGVQSADKVLQEKVEDLRETNKLLSINAERSDFHSVHLHDFAFVRRCAARSVAFSELISRGESAGLDKNGSVLKSLPDIAEVPEWTGRVAGTAIVVITIIIMFNMFFWVFYFLITLLYMPSSFELRPQSKPGSTEPSASLYPCENSDQRSASRSG